MTSLPKDWRVQTIADLRTDEGQSIVPSEFPSEVFDLFSVPNFSLREPERVAGADIGSSKKTVTPGTVLFCKINPRINRVWTVPESTGRRQIASTEWIQIAPNPSFEPEYLRYFLSQKEIRDYAASNVSGVGGSLTRIRPKVLDGLSVPIPPIDEQRAIVAEIETQFARLDDAVASLLRARARLKRYQASVLEAATDGTLLLHEPVSTGGTLAEESVESEDTDKYLSQVAGRLRRSLPPGWSIATIAEIAAPFPSSITDGPFGSNLKSEHYTESGPRVIRLQNIGDNVFHDHQSHISQEHFERLSKHAVESDDIVVAILGSPLPRSCVIPNHVGPAIVKADCVRIRINQELAIPKFVNYALNSNTTRAFLNDLVHGIGRPRLSVKILKSIPVRLPPLEEQARIVSEVERLNSLVDQLEATVETSLRRADSLRQAVLRRAFGTSSWELNRLEFDGKPEPLISDEGKKIVPSQAAPVREFVSIKESGTNTRSIQDVLGEAPHGLSPEELFRLAEFSAESVDDFYLDLRNAIEAGLIEESTVSGGPVLRLANV